MTVVTRQHRIPVRRTEEPINGEGRPTSGVLANLYLSDRYAVLNVGLPRCRPKNIRVTLGTEKLLVEVAVHLAQGKQEAEREYILAELPYGKIRRVFPLPDAALELDAGEAHFANGLLTVTIPTRAQHAYLREKRGGHGRQQPSSPELAFLRRGFPSDFFG